MTARDVASRLSEAQRRAMSRPDERVHPTWAGMISSWGDQGVANQLFDLGLTETRETLSCPTDLGRAVRQILKGQQ